MDLPLTAAHKVWYSQAVEALAAWVLQPKQPPTIVSTWPTAAWETFGLTAYLQGVLPLLWGMPWRSQLPPAVQAVIETGYRSNARRNQRLLDELNGLLTALAQAGIPAMPLKGSLLLENRLYPDPALRALHDLDILVQPEQLARATQVVQTLGYRIENRTWRHIVLHPPGAAAIVSWTQDHPDNPRPLDLHSHVREEFRGASYDLTAQLWQHARPRPFLGTTAWVPTTADLLHHLVAHASVSMLERLLRLVHLVDLSLMAQRHSPDLAPLSADGARFLYPALGLLAHYQPDGPLAASAARLATQVHAPLAAWIETSSLANRTTGADAPAPPGEMLRVWPRNRRERLLAVRHTLFHSRGELAALYPRLSASPFFWLAHVRFWARLLISWNGRGWHSLAQRVRARDDAGGTHGR
ncbi:nucleotidyltransferase family protein [Candidatus Amarolinea dominans]|uniref:nucleotidyltransferase domain-containing protein n=1 Tax=Candidatus Amarolinea dominans TaxID=3140696 RepID=UPI001DF77341|nr:nucleotidyltransferase family protein [Anaerolineae bacterium]